MALKYITLANQVLQDFGRSGTVGEKLPPASVLCKRYGVSYATMHKALQTLAERNMLRRASRRGTTLLPGALAGPPAIIRARKKLRLASAFNARVNAALNELLQKFCARQDNLEAEVVGISQRNFETRRDIFENADLLLVNEWMVRQYLTDDRFADAFLPLEDIGGFYWEPDAYVTTALRACRDSAGRLMALPLNASPVVSCQNLNYSRKARNFSADCVFEEFARRLKAHQIKGAGYRSYPLVLSTGMNRWPIILRGFGAELFSEDGRRCLLDRPEAVRAVEFLSDLMHVKHLCCLPLFSSPHLGGLFEHGHFLCSWVSASVMRRKHDFRFDFSPVPHGARRTTHLRLDALMVPRATESLTVVRDFLHFLMMPDNQLFFSAQADTFSCHRKIGEMFCADMACRQPGFDVLFRELEFAEPVVAAPRQAVADYVHDQMQLVWVGVEPPKQACRRIAAEANRMLAGKGEKNS